MMLIMHKSPSMFYMTPFQSDLSLLGASTFMSEKPSLRKSRGKSRKASQLKQFHLLYLSENIFYHLKEERR